MYKFSINKVRCESKEVLNGLEVSIVLFIAISKGVSVLIKRERK